MGHDTMTTEQSHMGETCRIGMSKHGETNVGETERVVSVMGGGVLALYGLARGGLMGIGMALTGGALVYRGVSGHCEAYHALGMNTSESREEMPATF